VLAPNEDGFRFCVNCMGSAAGGEPSSISVGEAEDENEGNGEGEGEGEAAEEMVEDIDGDAGLLPSLLLPLFFVLRRYFSAGDPGGRRTFLRYCGGREPHGVEKMGQDKCVR
jgi:hypothetical protein